MKYVWNKSNQKKYYPFNYIDKKVYVLCESAIFFVGMNNDALIFVTGEELPTDIMKEVQNISFEFQELLVRVADENQEEEGLSNVAADELNMLRRYVKDAKSPKEEAEIGEDEEKDRLPLGSFIRLLETVEERSRQKENPTKWMPAQNFIFENDGEKMKLSRYLGSKKKNLKVPSLYEYLPVSSLGEGAFSYSKYLENVILPECVEEIQENCFQGINSIKKIVFEENSADFPQLHYIKNTTGNSFLFGIVSWECLRNMLPEQELKEESEKKIAFANNGIIVLEDRELIKIDLFSKEEKRLEMEELVAHRFEKTLVETGVKNQKFLEESRWLNFFWKELKRYQKNPEDGIRNMNLIVRGIEDSFSCKEQEGKICFFSGEKEITFLDILVQAGENRADKSNNSA